MTLSADARHNPMTAVLRWILVLPAAIVGAVLVAFPVHWIVFATFRWGDDNIVQLSEEGAGNVERVVTVFAVPLALILCGARVAPSRRFGVAISLASLLVVLIATSFWIVLREHELSFTSPVRGIFSMAAFVVGTVTAIIVVRSWHQAESDSATVQLPTQPQSRS